MYNRILFTIGIILYLCLSGSPIFASEAQEIKTHCISEWAKDYRMQEFCIKQQTEALNSIQSESIKIQNSNNEIATEILETCKKEWASQYAGLDWRMVRYCYKNQYAAYKRLSN